MLPFANQLSRFAKIIETVWCRNFHHALGDSIIQSDIRGLDYLRDPRLNKGLGFTLEERQILGIHGLLPPRFKTQEEEVELCKLSVDGYEDDFNKYIYLTELQDSNEKLFFRLLSENVEKLMPIVSTPTVGLACQKFGLIYSRPRGLFITIYDKGHVYDVIKNWPEPDVKAIAVTDGERILSLGDLGASGMGIPIGKLALYTALAGIPPHQCLPILLDVGTNNKKLLEDPLYVGVRRERVTGKEYDEFIEEFMQAVVKRYGQNTLMQFEDFGNANAFRSLDRFRQRYCIFNGDIQGMAGVAIAGLISATRIVDRKLAHHRYLFFGAGEGGIGIAELLTLAIMEEGFSEQEANERIWMIDRHGLLVKDRPEKVSGEHQLKYTKQHAPTKNFLSMIKEVKPTVLIGFSAAPPGAFTPEILQEMAKINNRPIILSFRAECTAEEVYTHTNGRAIFGSSHKYAPVKYKGHSYEASQGISAFMYPGIALGVISTRIYHIRTRLFLKAARVIADNVTKADLRLGRIYPAVKTIQDCTLQIALKICDLAYDKGIATVRPRPKNMLAYLKSLMYNYNYESILPETWKYPELPKVKTKMPEPVIKK